MTWDNRINEEEQFAYHYLHFKILINDNMSMQLWRYSSVGP